MNADKRAVALEILAGISEADPAEITLEKDLVGDLGLDSPKALRLVVELEERFGIEISDEDAARMSTVGDVFAYVEAR